MAGVAMTALPAVACPARSANRVYVVRAADGALKVGLSSNLAQRLRDLSRGGRVELVASFRAPRFWTDALKLERKAHSILAEWRIRGEWFSPDCAHVIGPWIAAKRVARGPYHPALWRRL
jgi:predicted GIY-YIG superfamily endonuclease